MKENKTVKKKIELGLLATIASLSVALGGLFDSAEELRQEYPLNTKPIIETVNDHNEDQLKQKDTIKEKTKQLIYHIPVKVRTVFMVPLWALGCLLIDLAEGFYGVLIAPFARTILGFLVQTLIILLIIGIGIKLLFPDLPWSKIFSKKTILFVLAGSLFMSICDHLLPLFWADYRKYRLISRFLEGLLVIGIILTPFIRKKLKEPEYEIRYQDQLINVK